MLLRYLSGRATLGAVLLAVALGVIKFAARDRQKNNSLAQVAPAYELMAPERLIDSDWAYRGTLGKRTLRFHPDGTLAVVKGGRESGAGTWRIEHFMLKAAILGIDKPHTGIFRESIDEVSGPGPDRDQGGPLQWSARRIVGETGDGEGRPSH